MTTLTDSNQPPRIAAWLLNLFTSPDEKESILGDMLEEFNHIKAGQGIAEARNWYSWQTLKTFPHLLFHGYRDAILLAAGYALTWFLYRWSHTAVTAALDYYRVYDFNPASYLFLLKKGTLIGWLAMSILAGAILALAAKGRELSVPALLGLIKIPLAITACAMTILKTGDYGVLSTLPWTIAFAIGTLFGAGMVRSRRTPAPITAS